VYGVEEILNSGSEPVEQNTPLRDLAELEKEVTEGLVTYQAVGAALDEISSRRLYKPQYQSLEVYLKERWNLSRANGYRLIAAAKVAAMSPIGDKPKSEYQARQREMEKRLKVVPPSYATEFKKFKEFILRCEKEMERKTFLRLIAEVEVIVNGILHLNENVPCRMEVAV
jgi:hypothetical protein